MMDSQAVDSQTFLDSFMALLHDCALPLFEEAKAYAKGAGLEVKVEVHGAEKASPGLCLLVAHPEGRHVALAFSSCCITADPAQQKVLHEDFYSDSNQRRVQKGPLVSINQKMLHTRLATFFQTAFGLQPEYLAKQHPAGFW